MDSETLDERAFEAVIRCGGAAQRTSSAAAAASAGAKATATAMAERERINAHRAALGVFFDGISRCTPAVDIPLDVVVRVGRYVGAPHAVALILEVCVDTTAAARDATANAASSDAASSDAASSLPSSSANAALSIGEDARRPHKRAAAPWSDAMSMLSDVYTECEFPFSCR